MNFFPRFRCFRGFACGLSLLFVIGSADAIAVTFQVPSANVDPGAAVTVPVKVVGFERVTTFQFTLEWNPAVLQFVNTGEYGLPALTAGSFGSAQVSNGRLTVSWDDPDAAGKTLSNGTTILTARFTAIGGNGASSTVSFVNTPTPPEVTVDFELASFEHQAGRIQVGQCCAPSLTMQPASQTNSIGSSVSFSAAAEGTPPPSYQWLKDGTPLIGATGPNYFISNVHIGHAGGYSVVVSNSVGVVTSTNAFLVVTGLVVVPQPPTIKVQPASLRQSAGLAVTFNVGAEGDEPLTYQWRKDGSAIPGATSTSFSISSVQTADAGVYTVVVSNAVGSVASSNATLTVDPPASANREPVITIQPASLTQLAGSQAVFAVGASGSTPLSYQWRKNNENIPGATTAVLILDNVQPSDNANYSVSVSNPFGIVLSSIAVLTVGIRPVITTQLASRTNFIGATEVFSIQATGTVPLTYQWRKDGTAITSAAGAAFTLTNVQSSDEGSYSVVVSNGFGSVTSSEALLIVSVPPITEGQAPIIILQPANQTIVAGLDAIFAIDAIGTPPLNYQWQKNGVNIAGAVDKTLILPAVRAADMGSYAAVVRNAFGVAASAPASLVVLTEPSATLPPRIIGQPASQTKALGGEVTFAVDVFVRPPVSYFWLKDGALIPGGTNATLMLSNLTLNDAGRYTAVVAAGSGLAFSSPAILTIRTDQSVNQTPPMIQTHPADESVLTGASVAFSVEASGTSPLVYQWLKDGQTLPTATNSTLSLRNVQASDQGGYRVIVSNSVGTSSSALAKLTVNTPPRVTSQPRALSIFVGNAAEFAVEAAGSPPLSFQWRKNGKVIPGATDASFPIPRAVSGDAGVYSVEVTSPYGSVVSSSAGLTVAYRVPISGNFDGGGQPDLVFQDASSRLLFWSMKGPVLDYAGLFVPEGLGDSNWRIAASGDFDRDGNEDLILQHSDGTVGVWFLNGTVRSAVGLLNPSHPGDARWRVALAGDFDQNGDPDLLFQHADGTLAVWLMDGTNLVSPVLMRPSDPGDPEWRAIGIGDFNNDQKLDLVFQHKDGTLALWHLDQTRLIASTLLAPNHPGDARWRAVGTSNFDGDGKPGLLFQHSETRSLAVWFMDGSRLRSANLLNPDNAGGSWEVVVP